MASEIFAIAGTVVGIIIAMSSVYAAVVATRYRGRYEALASSLQLMSLSNTELRAENDKLRTDIADLRARIDVIQSDVVEGIVDQIAQAASIAITNAVASAGCPFAGGSPQQ